MKNLKWGEFVFPLIILGIIFANFYIEPSLVSFFARLGTQIYSGIFTLSVTLIFLLYIVSTRSLIFPKSISLIIGLSLVWMGITSLFSVNKSLSMWETLRAISFLMLFLTTYSLAKKNPQANSIILWGFGLISSIWVFKELYFYFLTGGPSSTHYFIGFIYAHNQMAGFLLFLIPTLVYFSFKKTLISIRILFAFLTLASIAALVMTYSRGGMLAFFLSLVIFGFIIFQSYKSKKFKSFNLLIISSSLIGLFILVILFVKPITNTKIAPSIISEIISQSRSVSGNLRTSIWKNSLKIVQNHPIFGIGPGAFGDVYPRYQTDPWLFSIKTHNYPLQVLSEMGIIGFIFFTLLVWIILKSVYQSRKLFNTKNISLITVSLAVAASFAHSFLDIDWHTISLFSLFWVILAIMLSKLQLKDAEIKITGLFKLSYIFLLIFSAIITFLIFAELDYRRGTKDVLAKDFSLALTSLQSATEKVPFDSRYYYMLGAAYEASDKNKAKEYYLKSIGLAPYYRDAYSRLGTIEFEQKNYEKSRDWTTKAINLGPFQDPQNYIILADTYLRLNQRKESERILKEAIQKRFPLNEAYYGFEFIYEKEGLKKDLAILYFRLIDLELAKMDEDNSKTDKTYTKELLKVIETNLDPQNPLIGLFKDRIGN